MGYGRSGRAPYLRIAIGLATSLILHCSKHMERPSVAAVHKSHRLVSMMSQLARAADVVMLAIEAIVKQAIVKPLAVGYHEHLGKDPGRSGGIRHRRTDRSAAGCRRRACRRSVSGRRGR